MSLLGLSTVGHWGGTGGDVIINTYDAPLRGELGFFNYNGTINKYNIYGFIEQEHILGKMEIGGETYIVYGFPTMWGTWGI